jgi:iron complex outermembrane receptor protein
LNQDFLLFNPLNPPTFSTMAHDNFQVHGGNLLGRWTRTFSDTSELKVQLYYDRTERDQILFKEQRDTFDASVQHQFALGNRNEIVWGLGYHITADREQNNLTLAFNPEKRSVNLFSTFVQDELALLKDDEGTNVLALTLGSKFEHNDFTGFEVQPGARLAWTPWERHSFWASASRAVRTPSRAEDDIILTQSTPFGPVTDYGSRHFESEELMAYELGYRARPLDSFSLDIATFYNEYDHLRSIEAGPSPTQPVVLPTFPLHAGNNLYGETYGVEASATWQVSTHEMFRWRLQPAYTFLQMQLHTRRRSTDTTSETDEGKNPHHQVSLRSSMDFPHGVALDLIGRYVDNLPAIHVPAYFSMDARLAWQINPHLEIAIVGQNLVESHHAEFAPSFIASQPSEIPRSVYGKITWRF